MSQKFKVKDKVFYYNGVYYHEGVILGVNTETYKTYEDVPNSFWGTKTKNVEKTRNIYVVEYIGEKWNREETLTVKGNYVMQNEKLVNKKYRYIIKSHEMDLIIR